MAGHVVEAAEVVAALERQGEQLAQLARRVAELHRGGGGQVEPGDERGVAAAGVGHRCHGEGGVPVERGRRSSRRGDVVAGRDEHGARGQGAPPPAGGVVSRGGTAMVEGGLAQAVGPPIGAQEAPASRRSSSSTTAIVAGQRASITAASHPAVSSMGAPTATEARAPASTRRGPAQHEQEVLAVLGGDGGGHQLDVDPGVVTAAQAEGHHGRAVGMISAERDAIDQRAAWCRGAGAIEHVDADERLGRHAQQARDAASFAHSMLPAASRDTTPSRSNPAKPTGTPPTDAMNHPR